MAIRVRRRNQKRHVTGQKSAQKDLETSLKNDLLIDHVISHHPEEKGTGPRRGHLTDDMEGHVLARDHAAGAQGGTRTDLVVEVQEKLETAHGAAAQEETEIDHEVGVLEEGTKTGLAVGVLGGTETGHVVQLQGRLTSISESAACSPVACDPLCIVHELNFLSAYDLGPFTSVREFDH